MTAVRALALLAWITAGCTGPTPYTWELPEGFPQPLVPEDNPMTVEKVELGRYLFYDVRLSANGTQSCASCHRQSLAFSDGLTLPVGSTGQTIPRNSLTLTNAAYSSTLTWVNPLLTTLEQQAHVPLFGEEPVEMGVTGHDDEVLDRLRDDAVYQELFGRAFPGGDPVSFTNVIAAISSFVRTLISGNSPYDRFTYQGDLDGISESAQRGAAMFFSERLECHHCHGGINFSQATKYEGTKITETAFFNTGLYNVDGAGSYPASNPGLIEFTGEELDAGRFKAPTLRNVAMTAPYFHDGSAQTLEEVLAVYEAAGRLVESGPHAGDGRANPYKSGFMVGFTLTDEERADVLAFLESLTDEVFLHDPRLSNPFE